MLPQKLLATGAGGGHQAAGAAGAAPLDLEEAVGGQGRMSGRGKWRTTSNWMMATFPLPTPMPGPCKRGPWPTSHRPSIRAWRFQREQCNICHPSRSSQRLSLSPRVFPLPIQLFCVPLPEATLPTSETAPHTRALAQPLKEAKPCFALAGAGCCRHGRRR